MPYGYSLEGLFRNMYDFECVLDKGRDYFRYGDTS